MTNTNATGRYRRILVKLSGEALLGGEDYGIDPVNAQAHSRRGPRVDSDGVQLAVVLGRNIFREQVGARRHGTAVTPITWYAAT